MTNPKEGKILIYRGKEYPNYTIFENGDIINAKSGRKITGWKNGKKIYVGIYGVKSSLAVAEVVFSTFKYPINIRDIGFKDGDPSNHHISNLYDKRKGEKLKYEPIPKAKEIKPKKNDDVLGKYSDDETTFARQQLNFIFLSNNFTLTKKIRKSAIELAILNNEELSESIIDKYSLKYIIERQREIEIKDLPLFKGPSVIDIYKEYNDVLPFINKDNIGELVTPYINKLISEGLIKTNIRYDKNRVVFVDSENDSISFNIEISDNVYKTLLSLVRIVSLLEGTESNFSLPF